MAQSKKVDVKVQNRSGFDKSHKVLTTLQCGSITPILMDELMPNSKVNLKIDLAAQLPPLCSDVYARMCLKAEAFFVPTRLLYGGWQDWLMGNNTKYWSSELQSYEDTNVELPKLQLIQGDFVRDNLTDCFDCRWTTATGTTTSANYNIFPYLAYHKVWDDWYRNSLVQQPCFKNLPWREAADGAGLLDSLPWATLNGELDSNVIYPEKQAFQNGVNILDLHQRNFDSDYFTNATPHPENGTAQNVSVVGNSFSISSLRVANSLQKYAERNNLGGTKYNDWLKAQYGADLSDGVCQRSLLLGSAKFSVYTKGIYNTAQNVSGSTAGNPFGSDLGGKGGSAFAQGSDFIIKDFTANEPGYLIVNVTLMPEGVSYGTGTRRVNKRYTTGSVTDLANPLLQGVGNQPIYQYELRTHGTGADENTIFGYTERFADWKTMTDSVRGGFKEIINAGSASKKGLSTFVLQRNFSGSTVQMGSQFLEIPKDYMDDITLVKNAVSDYGAMLDSYMDYFVAMPLAQYCQPTLEASDEEHQHTVKVNRNGNNL